jgi:hypothetical protein
MTDEKKVDATEATPDESTQPVDTPKPEVSDPGTV